MPNNEPKVDWVVRVIGTVLLTIVSTAVFFTFSMLGDIKGELARVDKSMEEVSTISELSKTIEGLKFRLQATEGKVTAVTAAAAQPSAYAQLSSARTQTNPQGSGNKWIDVHMELRDAVKNMGFDPRRDSTHLQVQEPGAYFIIAVPQTKFGVGCLDLWMAVNDENVSNSNIRMCHGNETLVGASQGVMCLQKDDNISIRMTGVGIEATSPENAPLIPAIILSTFRLGEC